MASTSGRGILISWCDVAPTGCRWCYTTVQHFLGSETESLDQLRPCPPPPLVWTLDWIFRACLVSLLVTVSPCPAKILNELMCLHFLSERSENPCGRYFACSTESQISSLGWVNFSLLVPAILCHATSRTKHVFR